LEDMEESQKMTRERKRGGLTEGEEVTEAGREKRGSEWKMR
jgi:hypothetical protein